MSLLINPGSHIGEPGEGWTNTYPTALATAQEWLSHMAAEGLSDVELLPSEDTPREGRWTFWFHHKVTDVAVALETHGIDDVDAYEKRHIFTPRVYWNGSSTGSPELENFRAEGFEPVQTYRRTGGAS